MLIAYFRLPAEDLWGKERFGSLLRKLWVQLSSFHRKGPPEIPFF